MVAAVPSWPIELSPVLESLDSIPVISFSSFHPDALSWWHLVTIGALPPPKTYLGFVEKFYLLVLNVERFWFLFSSGLFVSYSKD